MQGNLEVGYYALIQTLTSAEFRDTKRYLNSMTSILTRSLFQGMKNTHDCKPEMLSSLMQCYIVNSPPCSSSYLFCVEFVCVICLFIEWLFDAGGNHSF